jgi:hypothetical protein
MTTLTYQPDQGNPEFSEEELNSIQVGEQMEQEQQQLLAGKYESAEELEKAYVELQQKFSQGNEPQQEVQEQQEQEPETDVSLLDTLWEEAQSDWTEDTLNKLRESDPVEIAQAYLELRAEANQSDARELTTEETDQLYELVGGEDRYGEMMRWASSNLDEGSQQLYDSVMQKGDHAACFFAVQALAFRMAETAGWDSQDFITGGSAPSRADAFRSQAEVVAAMQDPRYDNDPAYRQDVMEKLGRSTDLMY